MVKVLEYKFASNENYEDLSCGRVIYHRTGFSNFPVRLASEIFMRCFELIGEPNRKVSIYDPCCGGGYLLTVLGFLHQDQIMSIYGSDISPDATQLAESNLNLLTTEGLLKRKEQLEAIYGSYHKESHLNAIKSASNLLGYTREKIECYVFNRDILSSKNSTSIKPVVDIIITDVPYGDLVSWSNETTAENEGNINKMLNHLLENLNDDGIVAISSDKRQKISNLNYKRIKKFQVGKRKVEILRKV